jgi:prevent-host-death family protein
MHKEISTQELRASIGEIMDAVRHRGDRYVVRRRGKPVAAVVPLSMLEINQQNRRRLVELTERVSGRNNDISEEEFNRLIDKAIAEVRSEKRSKEPQL